MQCALDKHSEVTRILRFALSRYELRPISDRRNRSLSYADLSRRNPVDNFAKAGRAGANYLYFAVDNLDAILTAVEQNGGTVVVKPFTLNISPEAFLAYKGMVKEFYPDAGHTDTDIGRSAIVRSGWQFRWLDGASGAGPRHL